MEIVSPGKTLVCEIADFDASDQYLFRIDKVRPALEVTWKLKGCPDNGAVKVGGKALDGGTKLITLSQGNVSRWKTDLSKTRTTNKECKGVCDCHTLPFLLSRAAFKGLASGTSIELNAFGETATYAPRPRRVTRTVAIDGKSTKLRCLRASGSGGELWVNDDAEWPLLARIETGGGSNYCELQLVSGLALDELEAQLGDPEDG
jgi:hypothetical protein